MLGGAPARLVNRTRPLLSTTPLASCQAGVSDVSDLETIGKKMEPQIQMTSDDDWRQVAIQWPFYTAPRCTKLVPKSTDLVGASAVWQRR